MAGKVNRERTLLKDIADIFRRLKKLEAHHVNATILGATTQDLADALEPEDWHLVGAAGEPAFENSWVNFDGTTASSDAGFRKDAFGQVHIKGFVKDGSALLTTVFTLPLGYRPTETLNFPLFAGGGTPRWGIGTVTTAGLVEILNGSATTAQGYAFDGISFFTD